MRRILNAVLLVALVILVQTTPSWAQVTPYDQDFEALVLADAAALSNDGWFYYVNVAAPSPYGYGGAAPNGPQICALVTGEGGATQGTQQLSVYSDYNNADHGLGYLIETNVYQQQTVVPGDIGRTVTFTFDAKMGNLGGSSTAQAFIKTFDSGWGQTDFQTTDMTAIPTTWGTYSVMLTIPANTVTLQFGFMSTATNYESCGIFYDNVNQPVPVELTGFSVE